VHTSGCFVAVIKASPAVCGLQTSRRSVMFCSVAAAAAGHALSLYAPSCYAMTCVRFSSLLSIITRKSSYCFQRFLAIAVLSVRSSLRLSHGWISQKRC